MDTKSIMKFCENKPAYKYANCLDTNDRNEIVYHYTNINALNNIITQNALWLTKSDYLNDRSEIEYTFDLIFNLRYQMDLDSKLEKRILKCLYLKHDFFHRCFLLSSSKDRDSYPLWSNYSNNEGYNLGFSIPDFINAVKQVIENILGNRSSNNKVKFGRDYDVFLKDVIYDMDTQKKMINEIFESNKYIFNAYNNGFINIRTADRLMQKVNRSLSVFLLLFKNPYFMAEKESRLIIIFKKDSYVSKFIKHRIFNGSFIPYIELNFQNNDSGRIPIQSVTIGPGNNSDLSSKGLISFLNSYGFIGVDISSSKVPLRY